MTETSEPRYARRLSDKILIAFHAACDQGNTEVAGQLLGVLDFMFKQTPNPNPEKDRRHQDGMVAAHVRLWALRHPEVLER
jgi:hypothetical protein